MDDLAGVSVDELAELAQVARTTAHRWKAGTSRVPHAVLKLVRIRVYGDAASALGAAWSGWRFGRDGLLYGPAWRTGFAPGEVLAMPFLYARIAALETQRREVLRARRVDRHHGPARRIRR